MVKEYKQMVTDYKKVRQGGKEPKKTPGKNKKPKPYILEERLNKKGVEHRKQHSIMSEWMWFKSNKWHKIGRYTTEKIATVVIKKQLASPHWGEYHEYRIINEDNPN